MAQKKKAPDAETPVTPADEAVQETPETAAPDETAQKLAALEEEHIKLLARYESTFDLTSIKEAAETAGMAKPSASQIFYVDLSAPDNVVLYEKKGVNLFGQVFTSMGHNMGALVEYFK